MALGGLVALTGIGRAHPKIQDSQGSANKPAFHVEVVARNLEVVWSLVFPSRDLVFLTERPGRVRALQKGQLVLEPLLTLDDVDPTFKMGAMGLALHPQYGRTHWLYLAYTYKSAQSPRVRVVRFKVNEKAIGQAGQQPLTERTTMIEDIPAFTNHAGCRLRFGPDKKLYITTGDANVPELAQKLDSLAGKILRLNDDGTIPADNPFVGKADGTRPEIWSYGHRNSQGTDWQPGTNTLFETEHGPTGGDEVNIVEKGKNYGWPVAHHELNQPGMEAPLLVYGVPSLGPGSSMFYRGKAFPEFRGDFFVGCMRSECILRIRLDGRRVISQERLLEKQYGRIREVAEGPDGNLYFTTSMRESDGRPIPEYDQILRLVPDSKR